jgi:hypothetical protein
MDIDTLCRLTEELYTFIYYLFCRHIFSIPINNTDIILLGNYSPRQVDVLVRYCSKIPTRVQKCTPISQSVFPSWEIAEHMLYTEMSLPSNPHAPMINAPFAQARLRLGLGLLTLLTSKTRYPNPSTFNKELKKARTRDHKYITTILC